VKPERFPKIQKMLLRTFERKILRRIYGPVQDNGQWRIRYYQELYELYEETDFVTCIKLKRLEWAGHDQRMESPGKDGKMRWNRMLPAFCAVATGSWSLMI
jgi:hypothetical protein